MDFDDEVSISSNVSVEKEDHDFSVASTEGKGKSKYNRHIFMISTRPISSMKQFSDHTLLFNPTMVLYCRKGIHCSITNPDHIARYSHTLPPPDEPTTQTPEIHMVFPES